MNKIFESIAIESKTPVRILTFSVMFCALIPYLSSKQKFALIILPHSIFMFSWTLGPPRYEELLIAEGARK